VIGSLGEVSFEVSGKKVKTFDGLTRNAAARLAFHELINRKPLAEFVGAALESVSFSMTLSAYLGLNPIKEAETLRKMRDEGLAVPFILDGKPQGDGLWLLESLSETWKYIDASGKPGIIECSLTLKEYIENVR
jgi:phage protein U